MRGKKHRRFRGRNCCGEVQVRGREHVHSSACSLIPGERAVIHNLQCERGHRRRLLSVGMAPGREVVCVRGNGRHGLCLRVGNSEFFLNRHMADKIQIQRVQ